MINKKFKIPLLLITMSSILLFSGCNENSNSTATYPEISSNDMTDISDMEEYTAERDKESELTAMNSVNSYEGNYKSGNSEITEISTDTSNVKKSKAMKHYSVNLNIKTLDYDKTMEELYSILKAYDSNIINASESDSNNNWYYEKSINGVKRAYIDARVPTEVYEKVLTELKNIYGQITHTDISSLDNTRTYNYNNDRLLALEAEKKNMERLMDEAQDAESLAVFYSRLTEINTEIAVLKNTNNDIEYDTDYSKFIINVETVSHYIETTDINAPYTEKLANQFNQGKENFIKGLQNITLALAGNWFLTIATIIMLLIPICLFSSIFKMSRKTKKINKNTKKENKQTHYNNGQYPEWNAEKWSKIKEDKDTASVTQENITNDSSDNKAN